MAEDVQDISDALRLASSRIHDVQAVVSDLRRRVPESRISWDEGSGEAWVRMFRGEDLIASLNRSIPLAFALGSFASQVCDAGVEYVVVVSSFSEPELSASAEALEEAFPRDELTHEFNLRSFSVGELYWETV